MCTCTLVCLHACTCRLQPGGWSDTSHHRFRPEVCLCFKPLACSGVLVVYSESFGVCLANRDYPAAGFPVMAKQKGAIVMEINIEPTPVTDYADISLFGTAGEKI